MTPLFPPLNFCYLVQLQEKIDPQGKHLDYRDQKGVIFAHMVKVHKTGNAFVHLFDVFKSSPEITAELRDTQNNLLLTTTSVWGSTKHDCKVDIQLADGTLIGTLRDAPFGVDFETPDGKVVCTARRPNDRPSEPMEVEHTFADAAGEVIGTCERSYPNQEHGLWDFLEHGGANTTGFPLQTVTLEPTVDERLRTFLFLFPALQHLRYSKSS